MQPHRRLPDGLAVRCGEGVDAPHLPGGEDDLGRRPVDRDRPDHGRVLEVVVADVVPDDLTEPEHLSGRAVERDERVGVEVRPRPARAVRVALRPGERSRVRDREEHTPGGVDRRRVPEAAARVHPGVAPEPGAVGDRVELPARRTRLRVEGVDDPVPVARVERLGVPGDRAEEDGAVVHRRRHVDPFLRVPGQLADPAHVTGRGVEGERGPVGGAEERVVAEGDAVRTDAGAIERVLPEQCAGVAVERVDVAAQILEVDRVSEHDRVAGELPERSLAPEPERPFRLKSPRVGRVDLARRRGAGVAEVEVVARPLVREGRQLRRRCAGVGGRPCAAESEATGCDDGRSRRRKDQTSHEELLRAM